MAKGRFIGAIGPEEDAETDLFGRFSQAGMLNLECLGNTLGGWAYTIMLVGVPAR